jgi:hypothetical protein
MNSPKNTITVAGQAVGPTFVLAPSPGNGLGVSKFYMGINSTTISKVRMKIFPAKRV